jgi:hypothetical protein
VREEPCCVEIPVAGSGQLAREHGLQDDVTFYISVQARELHIDRTTFAPFVLGIPESFTLALYGFVDRICVA